MRKRFDYGFVFLVFGLMVLPMAAQTQDSHEKGMGMGEMHHAKPIIPTGPVKITFGEKSGEWTTEQLAALPHVTIKVFNEHAKAEQSYSGVPVMELLKTLGVPEKPHGKDFNVYMVAEGSDGYKVVYSVAEATPDVHDGTILLADAMDGKPLGDNGPIQLVMTGEKCPARWVRNLVTIRVKTAD